MQKEYILSNNSVNAVNDFWDNMWLARTIQQELEACDIEKSPREMFRLYLSKSDKIIDAGCGFGKWVIYLHRLGYNITGIDSSKLAITKLREFDSTLQVELGDIQNIPYPDNYFDAYISIGVVEHFEEGPKKALKEAYRLVKPGGLIIVSVPVVNIIRRIIRRPLRNCINSIFVSIDMLKAQWPKNKLKALLSAVINMMPGFIIAFLLKNGKHYRHFIEYRYSKSEIENFIRQAGFEIIKTGPHDYYDSGGHSAGLWTDFPFLRDKKKWSNFRLNSAGRMISYALDGITPWIACGLVICVAKSMKEDGRC